MKLITIAEDYFVDLFYNTVFLTKLFDKGVDNWEPFEEVVEEFKKYVETDEFKQNLLNDIIDIKEKVDE